MAIALPIVVDGQLVGTGFVAGRDDKFIAIVTTLHSLGNGLNIEVAIPPHMGDMTKSQIYPINILPTIKGELIIAEQLYDLAIIIIDGSNAVIPIPKFIREPQDIGIGEEVLVVGYPYSIIGSVLETVEPSTVSALGKRILLPNFSVDEFILARQTHPGSSGSPVIRKKDGTVCGIIRGCLAPPEILSIGNIPLGTDSSVTYTISAHIVPQLISIAFQNL